ncbi:unnamed protein product (macronuclear) [Paramecium tetraurelia]|uniref:PH domain-containing protein n=1 Tax=Paramecium tetraurelia TaxID=5888 RepID=A0CWC6_PARTE|nr:uncharacterized protein GSPATT00001295001 [Paramecium tetraurelia]CAK75093.1 unnamed protein product [Paramecium tetraurelia]|eukprot:XP_001442490.1 hypothetical protein (macronuclear) [Paramecium tetraurelia strain d4-2]
MSTLYLNKFETNTLNSPLSDRSHSNNKYKQLTKNYFQKKYLLLTAGNEKSIKAWRNYLINSFRKKMEEFFNLKKLILSPQNRGRKLKLGRLDNPIKQFCYLSDEIIALNALAKQKVPGIDLIQEQDKLIKTNYQYLKNSDNVDYDSKMQSMIQQYEVIINRIQKEAFKIHLPNYIQVKMQNYNDFYDVDNKLANPYFSSKLYDSCQQLKFQNKKLVKNSQQISICENIQSLNIDEPIQKKENKIQPQKSSSKPLVIEQNLTTIFYIMIMKMKWHLQNKLANQSQSETNV